MIQIRKNLIKLADGGVYANRSLRCQPVDTRAAVDKPEVDGRSGGRERLKNDVLFTACISQLEAWAVQFGTRITTSIGLAWQEIRKTRSALLQALSPGPETSRRHWDLGGDKPSWPWNPRPERTQSARLASPLGLTTRARTTRRAAQGVHPSRPCRHIQHSLNGRRRVLEPSMFVSTRE